MVDGGRQWSAVAAGAIRLSSGVSFLVAPAAASRLWSSRPDDPTARLLLRSMGYRDALIGGMLLRAGLRGEDATGWFLASGGADLADLVGGIANHDRLPPRARTVGDAGAAVGIAVGLIGAAVSRRRSDR
jgi:hypothetical protein